MRRFLGQLSSGALILALAACGGDAAPADGEAGADPAAPGGAAAAPPVPNAPETEPPFTPADFPDLKIEVLTEGQGDAMPWGKRGKFHYTGMFPDGRQFDSSYDRGQPYEVTLDTRRANVIKGWQVGLQDMKVGERRRLVIPPALGYGEAGTSSIPGGSTLVFIVELVEIVD